MPLTICKYVYLLPLLIVNICFSHSHIQQQLIADRCLDALVDIGDVMNVRPPAPHGAQSLVGHGHKITASLI